MRFLFFFFIFFFLSSLIRLNVNFDNALDFFFFLLSQRTFSHELPYPWRLCYNCIFATLINENGETLRKFCTQLFFLPHIFATGVPFLFNSKIKKKNHLKTKKPLRCVIATRTNSACSIFQRIYSILRNQLDTFNWDLQKLRPKIARFYLPGRRVSLSNQKSRNLSSVRGAKKESFLLCRLIGPTLAR